MNELENLRKRAKQVVRDHRAGLVRDVAWRAFPQLFVRDVEVSLGWYQDVLGFAVDYKYGEPPFYGQVSRDSVALDLRRTEPWGQVTFVVRDPDGNRLSFGSPMP